MKNDLMLRPLMGGQVRQRIDNQMLCLTDLANIYEIERVKHKAELMQNENRQLKEILKGYENVLKQHEQELENAYKIISMYENIVEYSRDELKRCSETAKAHEINSELGRDELYIALEKIKELEQQNEELRKQTEKIRNSQK